MNPITSNKLKINRQFKTKDSLINNGIKRYINHKSEIAGYVMREDQAFAKGCFYGVILSIPIWILIFYILYKL